MVAAKRPSARAAVLRTALLFSPFFAVTLLGFILLLVDTLTGVLSGGRIVVLIIVGCIALLFGYQVVQSLRDLFSNVTETTGVVERRWSRNEFFLFRSSYIFVDRDIFRLEPEQYIFVDVGDTVRVVHYPHTSTVASIEVLARGSRSGRPLDA